MNREYYIKWFHDRLEVADRLIKEYGRSVENDATILLCCALSAVAATIWPGRGIDRKRFVQTLVVYSPNPSEMKRISVPLLLRKVRREDPGLARQLLEKLFAQPDEFEGLLHLPDRPLPVGIAPRIWTTPEIDRVEEQIQPLLPNWQISKLRNLSHAAIIYSDLRSPLVHEYQLSERLTESRMSRRDDVPSYVNYMEMPDEEDVSREVQRTGMNKEDVRSSLTRNDHRLHFPYKYFRGLVVDIVSNALDDVETSPQKTPTAWWIYGNDSST